MRSTTSFRAFCSMTLAAAGLLSMPGANAQDRPSPAPSLPTAPEPKTTSDNIPDNKLDAAAAAVKKVSSLAETFEKKLAQAPAAEKERLVGEANDAMAKAVTDQGLSVEEYTAIMKVAQNDPAVRSKLLQRLQ